MAIDTETPNAALIDYQIEQERIEKAIADLQEQLKGGTLAAGSSNSAATRRKRKMSAAARKRIAAAQKKRWAEYHKTHKA